MPTSRLHAVSPSLAVALGGLAAGVIDITYACTFWAIKAGARPSRILQSVAAGLLGRQAAVAGGASLAQLERDSAPDLTNGSPRLTNCTAASATMDP